MRRTTAHRAFRRTMNLIAGGKPLASALKAIVQAVEAEDPTILCGILLLDADRRRLLMGAAPSLPTFYNQAIEGVEIGPSVGSCGTAAYLGRRVMVDDIQSSPLWVGYQELAAQAGLAACWSEPIKTSDGAVAGTFAIYHREVSKPNKEDIAFIEAAAQLAAFAIDRRRAEEELAASEARARLLAEQALETSRNLSNFFDVSADLLSISNMQGRFVKVNRAWETALGYPIEALEGVPFLPLLHPEDQQSTRVQINRIEVDDEVNGFVNRYRRADGSYCQLEWRARRCDDLVFGVARDVTERLRIQAEMAEARDAAEAANRAKNDFLANMSHEIRTPLNGVIALAAALDETPLTSKQAEMVAMIRRSGETLERLVSDILDVSKIEAGQMTLQPQAFDLGALVDGLLDVTRLRAKEKGVAVRLERSPTAAGGFLGDSVRIGQVLSNLFSNAVKFTDQGEVIVRVDVEEAGNGQAARLFVEVEDTGVGFDAEKAEMIFQRFNQADSTITRRFGGSGLGLSISKTLVEMMGGEITAQSSPGAGSLFRVTLPLSRTQMGPDAEIDAPRSAAPGEGLKVLLAEDHPINQRVVQLILEPCGAAVTVVENGAQAVEAMASGAFDVVLMDMQMPVMDGLAATRAIRAREGEGQRTPIIMLSANAMDVHRREALQAGADLHVPKPITIAALLDSIGQVMAR
ncbi:hybrid sensor histidine kinase/response regulator [Caulobacter vibrioides]|uniref:Sensory/regulatory protein RpfC n=2 Tax=Caulobacter vibrioides TaxID=155892 RepID=Q9A501_CAUVC|nr:ATP-binding protein [Caulobacter vibrioides]YP_002518125.1 GAF/PAS-family histidine kinase/receiver protein [Caulobacter vibrioides NA1000]AAK24637.1 sensory box histidine kinase/response regulator [Caulobacter vibrioides CB15]ACL96217.1 GAF/PAS-family histidine kinase/receiver protein [Caulobacter vibrioides NA1000]ATC29507.1 hybrid sensor histidine kinase/response regulator [Caulobacter vibrioides]QXZ51030.1 response regulator [Caulobacter vibrioides]